MQLHDKHKRYRALLEAFELKRAKYFSIFVVRLILVYRSFTTHIKKHKKCKSV